MRQPERPWTWARGGRCLAAAIFLAAPLSLAHAKPPERIVSINLCTDQVVLMLARPGTVKSVSRNAASPSYSPLAHLAKGIPVNHARVEDILPYRPDAVFASAFEQQFTQDLLSQLGYRVIAVPQPETFDGIRSNVRLVAAVLGQEARGEAIIRDFDETLARSRDRAPPGRRPLAVVLHARGYTEGGKSLVTDLVKHVGLRNLADERGIVGWTQISIESILLGRPDLVILGAYQTDAPSQAREVLRHPALEAYAGRRNVVGVPTSYWSCGTPHIAEIATRMAAAAEEWAAR